MMNKKFTKVTTKPLKVLKERRIKGKRHWENHKGQVFPSVTTVLSIIDSGWVKDWKNSLGESVAKKIKKEINISDDIYDAIVDHSGEKTGGMISAKSTTIGTKAHKVIEDYLNNKKLDFLVMGLCEKAHFENIRDYLDKIDRIRSLEANLFSEELGIAGRVDAVADYCGELSVIDFKTGNKMKSESDILTYKLQVTAYALMYNELMNANIKTGIIIMSGADGGKGVFKVNIHEYEDQLRDIIKQYKEK